MISARKSSIGFSVVILSLLTTVILTLYSPTTRANYSDIGYREGLALKATIKAFDYTYLQAEKSAEIESIGIATGLKFNQITVLLGVNKATGNYSAQLRAWYYDVHFSYGLSLSYNDAGEVGYDIEAGYAVSEKVALITSYGNDGVFFGVRRWF